jgi:GT2 family glycosyltransferase
LIVDNRSSEREAVNYLESLPARSTDRISIRVLHYDRDFNYSDLNNRAVEIARGELICLLNNDTEVISPDWLHEMVGHVIQPGVGAVGAKLLYGNGRVQHAGDVVGYGGCANHLHAGIEGTDPGYCLRAAVAQELSAVTGACLLTPRSIYTQIGGLDATFLRVTFNDVDFCLRLRKNGYKVIWTPYALLYHHESATRGRPKGLLARLRAKLEARVMRLRWAGTLRQDPFYNPNMARRRSDFTLAAPAAILRVASDAAGRRVAAST